MIVVGVALDTVNQIEAHLITRNYEGLSGGGGAHPRMPRAGRTEGAACDSSSSGRRGGEGDAGARSSARRCGIPQISTGDMLRAAKTDGQLDRPTSSRQMAAGGLVPDDVVIGLIDERTRRAGLRAGFLLDGFPRTVPQAEALDATARARGAASSTPSLALEVPRDLLDRACSATGARTNALDRSTILKYKPPPPGADLEHRADDQRRRRRKRLDTYEAMTAELLPYYEKRGILRRIDGVGKRGRGHGAGARGARTREPEEAMRVLNE